MNYDIIFYWIGVVSAIFFLMIGMSAFAAWVFGIVWQKFYEGKKLVQIIKVWREHGPRE